jgi:hypothetical protein
MAPFQQTLFLNDRIVVGTGHATWQIENLPFKGRNTSETHRSPGSREGRESRGNEN